jgi:hypothetical protein
VEFTIHLYEQNGCFEVKTFNSFNYIKNYSLALEQFLSMFSVVH